jgi:pyridoxamine 5'-phosphate oxidase family protein
MSVFTPAEMAYLQSQRIGRLATVGPDGQPHVVPIRFKYNPEHDTIDLGGGDFGTSKKFRDASRNPLIAYVVDDVPEPRKVRGIEIRGRAEIHTTGGEEILKGADPQFIRLRPTHIASWGIESDGFQAVSRNVEAPSGGETK